MPTVQLNPGPLGGLVQGNFGNYTIGTDGTLTVDARDAPALVAAGAVLVSKSTEFYTFPAAPAAATAGRLVASAALSNGALTIANQPDVMRQAAVRVDPGTSGITAGACNITYVANDGSTTTDALSLITAASTLLTQFTSKGVVHINTATVSALAGGATPHIQIDTTAVVSVPVGNGAKDFTIVGEWADGAYESTQPTADTHTLGSVAPTTAPNATHTYSIAYTFVN